MNQFNLNIKSYYNFLKSTLSIEDIINFSINNKLNYASLIDTNLYGAIEFYNACVKNNLKPILGLEFKYNDINYYLIAKDYIGYKTLCRINSFNNLNIEFDLKNEYDSNHCFLISDNNSLINLDYNLNQLCFNEINSLNEEDSKTIEILHNIDNENKMSIYDVENIFETNTHFEFDFNYNRVQIQNTKQIIDSCDLVINQSNNFIDVKFNNKFKDKNDFFYRIIMQGLIDRTDNFKNVDKQVYINRLNKEFELIKQKQFIDYFIVVSDFINYAKNNNILIGPGRGSAAGSLISYVLKITEVDPIKYNLLFERFLNSARVSLPDIDIDIMDTKRELIIKYLIDKYGVYNVGQIITFARYKVKSALRDIGRVLNIPLPIIDSICKEIPLKYDNDLNGAINNSTKLQEYYLNNKYLFDLTKKLLSFPRQHSIHAAGVILCNQEIYNIAPVQRIDDEKILVNYSMDFLEQLGLIKIDLLSLKNLTVIQNIIKLISYTTHKKIDLYKIDTHDLSVYKILTEGKTNGVFQFESVGMQNMLKRMNPKKIEDLALVSAIYRPGPLQFSDMMFDNKNNPEKIKYINDDLKDILSETYGVIIYQEQIINIVQKIANFNETEADIFRKAISKKQEDKILDLKKSFTTKAINNGYDQKTIELIFNQMLDFASYGFNKSHAISYALISYFIAYLKKYYPLETFTILLTNISDKSKFNEYKIEANQLGINFKNPSINLSNKTFTLIKNNIIFSFNSIMGIGDEIANKIITLREMQPNKRFESPEVAIFILLKAKIPKKTVISLIQVGCFDEFDISRDYLINIIDALDSNSVLLDNIDSTVNQLRKDNDIYLVESEYYELEKNLLGVAISESKYEQLNNQFSNTNKSINNFNNNLQSLVMIKSYEQKISKKQNAYLELKIVFLNNIYTAFIYDLNIVEQPLNNNEYYLTEMEFMKSKEKKFVIRKIIKKVN